QIVFTGGGTEANALAILGAARRGREASIVVSAVEHPSVMATAEKAGRVVVVPVGADGVVAPAGVADAVGPDTAVVAIMLVPNDIGTIQPVAEIARLGHAKNDRVHARCDAGPPARQIPGSA